MSASTQSTSLLDVIGEPTAVRAVLIDPAEGGEKISVSFVHIPTRGAYPAKAGLQLAHSAVEALLGSRVVLAHQLMDDEWLLSAANADGPAWFIAPCGVFCGRGLVVHWERRDDHVGDAMLDLEDVATLIDLGAEVEGAGDAAAAA
jgi:hypothetical protein